MAIRITAITPVGGAGCDHRTVTVNDEGTSRTFQTSLGEIDTMLDGLSVNDQKKMLVYLWAKYRRSQGRAILNVDIA